MTEVSDPTDLYGLPLEDFTTERNALARRLREDGETEQAARVASMRKPTTDAWALDQVARTHGAQIEELIGANRRLREARGGEAIREASEGRSRLIDDIAEAAARVLEDAGHSASETVRIRIVRTLLATAADPDAGAALAQGTLERPIEVSGQWPATGLTPSVESAPEPAEWKEELARLESKEQDLAARAAEAHRAAETARAEVDEARRKVERADHDAREADRAARDAHREADALRRRRPPGA